ncbi:MATE family efflux transporter [Romboutsia sp. 1001713B170207_170306_H8]|uniref:MATE family efflux transporter n=1 Tax=Romboutsia sp. 1001713B170207_170306_H8 TaxID=2787112 RepID=UPI0011C7C9E4|nr:MATE family efflux transporter [Romboutsia sp. 1001713B170207_170306_H8]
MEDKNHQCENKMGIMPINKLLITMSLPMIISMLVQALYNVVDSIFVSQISENALTAVSLAFPLQNFMIAVASGTGVGINALLSKSLGENNYEKANKAANNGIFLAIMSYILFLLVGLFGIRLFYESQTNIIDIIDGGCSYLVICTTLSFGLFGQLVFERLMQSTGKTFYTMITQGLGAIINIILDPILIFGLFGFPKMGIAGAAIATVSGQIIAMMLAIYFNIRKNNEIKINVKGFKPDLKIIKKIYSVGIPSIIMGSIASAMTFGMNKILIVFTSTATAVFGVYFKLQSFVFMPVFGLNNGMVPIVSYNYGAKNKDRMIKTVKISIMYAMGMMFIGLFVLQVFPKELLNMFNASEELINIGVPALKTISLSFLFAGFCIILGSMFQSLGNGILSLIVSVGRQLVVLLPVAYLFSKTGNLNSVWWAFPISEIASVILSCICFKYVYNKEIKPLEEDSRKVEGIEDSNKQIIDSGMNI